MSPVTDPGEIILRVLEAAGIQAESGDRKFAWQFRLGPGSTEQGRLVLDDGWARIEADLPAAFRSRAEWELLEANAHLPGACRIGRTGDDGPGLLLDIPWDDEAALASGCRAGVTDFVEAWTCLHRGEAPAPPAIGRSGEAPAAATEASPAGELSASRVAALLSLVREAGYSGRERDHGHVVIDLGPRGFQRQVSVDCRADGMVRFRVSIATRLESEGATTSPLSDYLLRLSGRRRLVSPVADLRNRSSVELGLEARLREPLEAALIERALASLALTVTQSFLVVAALGLGSREVVSRQTHCQI
jgi:hypothetical protein